MNSAIGVLLIIMLICFIIILQKWRKSVAYTRHKLEGMKATRKNTATIFFADMLCVGFIFFIGLILYSMLIGLS